MKKILSLVLVFATVFISFSFLTSTYAENEELSLEEYSSQLINLTNIYDVGSSVESTDNNVDLTKIPLNRLIIKTENNNPLGKDFGAVAKVEGYNNIHIMQYLDEETAEQAYNYYDTLSCVEYVEYDFMFGALEPETEYETYKYPQEPLSWGTEATNASKAVSYVEYYKKDAPEIIVAVLDTGIDLDHTFFEGRIVDSGINLIKKKGTTDDDNGHGTLVAGVIVDSTEENVKVSPYKVLNKYRVGAYSIVCAGIDRAVENNVDVINLSLCGYGDGEKYSKYEESIQNAVNNDIPVIVAAGNEHDDAVNMCPASNNDVITVAASDKNNVPAGFSNYGSCVDIAAPGVGIKSCAVGGEYIIDNGTSLSAPFVSAAAAFLKTFDKNFKPAAIERIIKESAFVPDGWDTKYGAGILDFSAIISNVVSDFPYIFVNESKKAEITYPRKNVTIYYTTDGSEPIAGISKIYSEPIDITSAVSVKAIACEIAKFPSACATLKINWKEDLTIRYKGTKDMLLPSDSRITYYNIRNEDVATVDKAKQTIYGASKGETRIIVELETGQKVTYNVTVIYEPWQEFIIYFLFGWIWYV